MASKFGDTSPVQEGPRNVKQERQQVPKLGRKKNDFFDKLDSLEREYIALEKERNTMMFSRRSDFRKEYSSLEESEVKTTSERMTEKQTIKQQLIKIKINVDKFQRELVDVKPTPAFVQKLKEMMEDIENCIMVFKEQQRKIYDDLIHGERTTQQEIKSLEKKFESWSQLPAPTTAAVTNKKAANAVVATSMPPAVAAFEKFVLQTGGHQGGWDDYDHQLFLKLKAKHKNKEAFLNVAGQSIPGKSPDEVRQHHDWFLEYMDLKESKRKAILEWRQHKEAEKEDLMVKTTEDDDEDEEGILKKNERLERERSERLARLKGYKEQKEQEKARREELKQMEEQKKREEREKEERRRLALKAQVEEYTRRRAEEEEILKEAHDARQEQLRLENQLSASELARIRERNSKMLQEKKSKIKAREEEIHEKQKRLEKLKSQVEVKAERDPSRLYKLTRGWEERRKDTQSGSGQVLHMPHRAVPSWRQGMS